MGTPGGLSDVHVADDDIQIMVDKMKPLVENKVGKKFGMFKAISFRTQVVAGTNYFIKVQACEDSGGKSTDSFMVLRIYKSLQGNLELSSMKGGLSQDSEITYFD